MANLYEPELPERIWTWPFPERKEWWEIRPVGEEEEGIPPLQDYLDSLFRKGEYHLEVMPTPRYGSVEWNVYTQGLQKDPLKGPHFMFPTNTLHMPIQGTFPSRRSWYRTTLHELSHSTAHASRLNRTPMNVIGSVSDYAREECIAELSGALLYVNLGGDPESLITQWSGYVSHWAAQNQELNRDEVSEAARMSARWMLDEVFEQEL